MSNIDKHRRLAITSWWPADLFLYWSADEGSNYEWKPRRRPPWANGTIIGHLEGIGPPPVDVVYDFNLALVELPFLPSVPDAVDRWVDAVEDALRQTVTEYVRTGPD